MLEDLVAYNNLGTPSYFFELFSTINKSQGEVWTKKNANKLFYNKIIDGRSIFDGCLILADKIQLIHICGEGNIALSEFIKDSLFSEMQMKDKFVEALFKALQDDRFLHKIFSSEHISYDIVYHSIQINNAAFSFKHSNFKQLLIDFGVIYVHPTPELKKFIFNSRYKKLFDKIILPEIKKKKVGLEELKKIQEKQQIHGEEAEKYVLAYENKRLKNKEGIVWVAEYSISEGYDIASFDTTESSENNRFIEVKSYQGSPYFYWSRNEIDISRIKGNAYYLYLIDRSLMSLETYEPTIIQNPFENVLANPVWEKVAEKYKVTLV